MRISSVARAEEYTKNIQYVNLPVCNYNQTGSLQEAIEQILLLEIYNKVTILTKYLQ